MKSKVISAPESQLTLSFEEGIAQRFGSLRECIATGVYQRGLGKCAIDLDKAPGNLSVELSEDPTRKFSVESLERYIEKTGDTTPIHYLIDRFLHDNTRKQEAAMAELAPMLQMLVPAMKKAGLM